MNAGLRWLAAPLLALALVSAGSAARAAEPGFVDYFSAICLKHVFDLEGARAEALSLGFAATDRDLRDGDRKLEAYEKSTPAGRFVLGVNATVRDGMGPIPQANAVTCGLYGSAADPAVAPQAAKWFATPEDEELSTDKSAYYLFSEIDGVRARVPLGSQDGLIDGLKKGRMWMVVVSRSPSQPAIMLTVLRASGQGQ